MSDQSNCCSGRTKQGRPCRAAATESGYCYFHANPGMAAELGRAGGRKNRHVVNDALRPLPLIDSITGVKAAVGQLIEDVYANRLHPKTAAGMASLINTMLRVLTAADLEQKVKQLENKVEKLAGTGGRME